VSTTPPAALSPVRLAVLVALAITAFAGNSLIARAALAQQSIGPGAYTALRLAAGAAILWLIVRPAPVAGSWRGALALLGYAGAFSFAYVALGAATGALILFAAVQLTIFAVALGRGDRPGLATWIGMALAAAGLVWLLLPGLNAPAPLAALAMALAGAAWGGYTLLGRGAGSPAAAAAWSFVIAAPLALPLVAVDATPISTGGALLAMLSGAVTSGLGYLAWYRALPQLSASAAAMLQLLTPPLTAVAGGMLLGEPLSWRIATASVLILAGVLLALRAKALPAGRS